ncbi:prepilin-type N-terminal cleavage/methylation domain-containing protein [Burkholderia gladioli]|jgi:prepilin-type N-terminal cleavage/methylation domain-containing protein|uniref:type 4 pilus major pilin n=1 Tax=Burkholderia gladioli TaxID=28095 RepID=UPI00155FC34E|nr:type 4 pilus major pilin [Burkholderia gladioli]NRF83855.1 prepilin-type N-terminal cleavage/methylation domain-containing protein [Burkholderia gladioli]
MTEKFKRLHKQKGYTLIELSIAGAIIALLIYGTVKLVNGVIADHRANAELQETPTIFTKIQKIYGNRPNFAGATQAILVNNGAFPADWVVTGSTNLVNRWSGPVTLGVTTIGGVSNNAITFSTSGVPDSECQSIVPGMDDSVRTTTVNGTVVKQDGQPSDPGLTGTSCTNGQNTIVYVFSK